MSDIDSEFDKLYQDEDQYDITTDRQKLALSDNEEAKDEPTKRRKLPNDEVLVLHLTNRKEEEQIQKLN